MKKFCIAFLKTTSKLKEGGIEKNAKKANKILKIAKKLWKEYSYYINDTPLFYSIGKFNSSIWTKNTAFMAGFVCGWAEKSKKKYILPKKQEK